MRGDVASAHYFSLLAGAPAMPEDVRDELVMLRCKQLYENGPEFCKPEQVARATAHVLAGWAVEYADAVIDRLPRR